MSRLRRRWFAALAPAALGALVWAVLALDRSATPILYLRGDLGALLLLLGVVLTVLLLGVLLALQLVARRRVRDLARAEERHAEERRRFLRRLDHELKNPLTAIQAGIANLVPDGAIAGAAVSVGSQAARLTRLVADLRKLADLETRPLEVEMVDLAAMLEELIDTARERPDLAGRRLALTLPRAPWPLPAVPGDRDLLFLLLYNLLDNALKFTRDGDTLEVRAVEDGAQVVIEVADTGPGISDEEQASVWDELYRGETARGVPGSGLGLPLVRAVAARHGGTVSLRSRPGQGTVVSLRLPSR